jgi:hypothetical protein
MDHTNHQIPDVIEERQTIGRDKEYAIDKFVHDFIPEREIPFIKAKMEIEIFIRCRLYRAMKEAECQVVM